MRFAQQPFHTPSPGAVSPEPKIAPLSSGPFKLPKRLHVLAVDDQRILTEAYALFLGLKGHTVETAKDGSIALRLYEENIVNGANFDLIITDLEMIEMNGDELVKRIRRTDKMTPIIILSAAIGQETVKSLQKEGNVYFMAKPFKPGPLFELIDRIPYASQEEKSI